jgi:hypothetical protein
VTYCNKQAKALRVSDRYSACLFAGRFFHSLINAGMRTELSEKSKAPAIIQSPMQAAGAVTQRGDVSCGH